MSEQEFSIESQVVKTDDALGLVFGYAIICDKDGQPYYDKQGDHIPEKAMLEQALDFMENSRTAGVLHKKDASGNIIKSGSVPFAFPLTSEIAKALEIDPKWTGLLIAMKPEPRILELYKSGELTGFSIGGFRIQDIVVEE